MSKNIIDKTIKRIIGYLSRYRFVGYKVIVRHNNTVNYRFVCTNNLKRIRNQGFLLLVDYETVKKYDYIDLLGYIGRRLSNLFNSEKGRRVLLE